MLEEAVDGVADPDVLDAALLEAVPDDALEPALVDESDVEPPEGLLPESDFESLAAALDPPPSLEDDAVLFEEP